MFSELSEYLSDVVVLRMVGTVLSTIAIGIGLSVIYWRDFDEIDDDDDGNNANKEQQKQQEPQCCIKPPKDATYYTVLGQRIRYVDRTITTTSSTPTTTTTSTTSASSTTETQQQQQQPPTILVFIHGFMGCLETWNLLLPKLQQQQQQTTKETSSSPSSSTSSPSSSSSSSSSSCSLRIITLDLPGCGFSDKPNTIPSLITTSDISTSQSDDKKSSSSTSSSSMPSYEYTFRYQGKIVAEFLKQYLKNDDTNNNNNTNDNYNHNLNNHSTIKNTPQTNNNDNNCNNNIILIGHSAGAIVATAAAALLIRDDNDNDNNDNDVHGKNKTWSITVQGLYVIAPGYYNIKPAIFSHPYFPRFLSRFFVKLLHSNRPKHKIATTASESSRNNNNNNNDNLSEKEQREMKAWPNDIVEAFESSWMYPSKGVVLNLLEQVLIAKEDAYENLLYDLLQSSSSSSSSLSFLLPIHMVWSECDKINPCCLDKIKEKGQNKTLKASSSSSSSAPLTYTLFSKEDHGEVGHYIQQELPGPLAEDLLAFCNRVNGNVQTTTTTTSTKLS